MSIRSDIGADRSNYKVRRASTEENGGNDESNASDHITQFVFSFVYVCERGWWMVGVYLCVCI